MRRTLRNPTSNLVAILWVGLAAPGLFAQESGAHLIITYQAASEERPALWEYARTSFLDRLEGWEREGVFQGHRLLFNSYVEDYTWDLALILRFDDYTGLDRWKEVEKGMPGGLDEEGLRLARPDHSYLSNVHFSARAEEPDPTDPVYFAIPYAYRSQAEYERYAQVYVLPQFDGWIDEGILNGYEVFLNRHPTGKPWDVLLLLEYRDTSAFGLRDDVKWGVRSRLEENPDWKLVSDIKHDFRTEWETVIAELVRR